MERMDLLSDHGEKALVRVIGIGGTSPTPNSAVEALKATGGTQVSAVPGRKLLFEVVVGDG
jgi:hypothetical protein